MGPTRDRRTDALLQRFRTSLHTRLPLRALWAHSTRSAASSPVTPPVRCSRR
ncbi:hypothetical protein [Streptomyces sp. N2A]|uniref:hypothetical protein n=1 Tax=Streptomyces sp. N2A TaxID=3073936 RepID=UPI00286FB0ED|nr:hypothetical protein [Streptomyces sp. N2A]